MFDPATSSIAPPRKFGIPGSSLWDAIQSEYRIDDPAGRELLAQACEAADRVATLAEKINADGAVIETKNGPKPHPALKDELAGRAFICRTLERLGLNLEAIKPVGGPTAWKKQQRKEPPGAD
jgi:hypothetical protein